MTTAVPSKTEGAVARPLHVLVPLIKQDLKDAKEAAEDAAKPFRAAAGEKLIEAKAQMPRGDWQPWLDRNFELTQRQASRWMEFARATMNIESGSQGPKSLHEYRVSRGTRASVYPQPWHDPVKEAIGRVNIERLGQDVAARKQEREIQRKLALSLIDIGYKALASKLHPDKGGSKEAMTRLNQVRDRLKGCA